MFVPCSIKLFTCIRALNIIQNIIYKFTDYSIMKAPIAKKIRDHLCGLYPAGALHTARPFRQTHPHFV